MRFLHTSDWHVGGLLSNRDRTQEHAAFLEELSGIVSEEKIEAVLISGDLFDTINPPAEAEKLVFDFFRVMAERRVPVVIIAGNHDSAARIEGKANLLQLVNVHAFGKPQRSSCIEIKNEKGESLLVAALPFTGEFKLLDWDESLHQDQSQQKSSFAEKMKNLLNILAEKNFKPGAINVLMAHLTVEGALLSGSEKSLRMSDTWALPVGMLPETGEYVALGHIHRYQILKNSPLTCYSGSPLKIDFGEEKDEKGVCILDAKAGTPIPQPFFRRLERITPLKTLRIYQSELQKIGDEYRDFKGYLKVVVKRSPEDTKIRAAEEIRKLLPQTLIVISETEKSDSKILPDLKNVTHDPVQVYKDYLVSRERIPTPELLSVFQELMEEASLKEENQ
jgi:exonuclease SbcD